VDVRPWQHSFSTLGDGAARQSEHWNDLISLHEFLDISKMACAHRYHRIVLHHVDLGSWVAEQAFPNVKQVPQIVAQHVREDLGVEASLSDWMRGVDVGRLPQPIERRIAGGSNGIAQMVAGKLPDQPRLRNAALTVAQFLFRPTELHLADQDAALCILMNPVGIAIVRRVFGPPNVEFQGSEHTVIDWGWLAEATVMACYGRIPDLREIVDAVVSEPKRGHRGNERRAA
jgi:hypothetical protein